MKICIFSLRNFLAKFQNLKYNKFGSNFVSLKENVPNSIILQQKNGGFLRPGRMARDVLI